MVYVDDMDGVRRRAYAGNMKPGRGQVRNINLGPVFDLLFPSSNQNSRTYNKSPPDHYSRSLVKLSFVHVWLIH